MTWIPDSPTTKTVAGPTVSKSIDRFDLSHIEIIVSSGEARVAIREGYDDLGLVEIGRSQATVTLGRADLDALKTAIYALLATSGDIPAGRE